MAIQLLSKQFSNAFAGTTTFYNSNVGDASTMICKVMVGIDVQTGFGNIVNVDPVLNRFIWANGSFLDEGFRAGDTIKYAIHNPDGSVFYSTDAVITFLTDSEMYISVDLVGGVPSAADGQTIRIQNYLEGGDIQSFLGLKLLFNHVSNDVVGNDSSLIDGEKTAYQVNLTDFSFEAIGKQSGGMAQIVSAEDITADSPAAGSDFLKAYQFEFLVANHGMFAPDVFDADGCLKLRIKFAFERALGDPNHQAIFIFNDGANTGYWNEPFNDGIGGNLVNSPISELSFVSGDQSVQAIVEGDEALGFGAMFLPTNPDYYKHKTMRQDELCMLLPTSEISGTLITSTTQQDTGASFDCTATIVDEVGSVRTVGFVFNFNPEFQGMMEAFDEGDRRFIVWIRMGSQNMVVYDSQLVGASLYDGPITWDKHHFVDHSKNVSTASEIEDDYTCDTEDDIAFLGTFLTPNEKQINKITLQTRARNTVTNDMFNLAETIIDASVIPLVEGVQPLDFSVVTNPILPTTSTKRNTIVARHAIIDGPGDFGVKIHYPILCDWRYWLSQLNANDAFFGNKVKNWNVYETGSWVIEQYTKIEYASGLWKDDSQSLQINGYNNNEGINSSIAIKTLGNAEMPVIDQGTLMKIVATFVAAEEWTVAETWGMITIEPFESGPRFLASTKIIFDSNEANPIRNQEEIRATIDYPDAKTARITTYLDSNLINTTNGVKITGKIKGTWKDSVTIHEERTYRVYEAYSFPKTFTEENRGYQSCCCEQIVMASSTSQDSWKNDVSSAWLKLSSPSDTVTAMLYVNDEGTSIPMVDFPNDASAKYCTIHWQDILLAFGEGCFRLELNYTIAGVSGSFIWGEYELQEFTTEGALGSARLRVKFNGVHQIEGINFRGSNVEDTMRFKGFIGHRQPNTQFDNIIYGDRVMKRVIRENLNEYEIQTDPISECVSKRILDLYLVSENELFIADYNAHNHSYRINDLPVIVEKSASVTYYDLSRLASIKAFVSDKIKNQRTFY